jgi:putative ATPase
MAIWRADEDVKETGALPVPKPLRDSHAAASRSIGAGKGYEYPHAHGGWVEQQYLPDELRHRRYYEPVTGREEELGRALEARRSAARSRGSEPTASSAPSGTSETSASSKTHATQKSRKGDRKGRVEP